MVVVLEVLIGRRIKSLPLVRVKCRNACACMGLAVLWFHYEDQW